MAMNLGLRMMGVCCEDLRFYSVAMFGGGGYIENNPTDGPPLEGQEKANNHENYDSISYQTTGFRSCRTLPASNW
jgi:hypothetical protein